MIYVKEKALTCLVKTVLQAAVLGFEPRNDGVRVRCLTVWRYRFDKKILYMNVFEKASVLLWGVQMIK